MLDHVSLGVKDLPSSVSFYSACLAPLGMKPIMSSKQSQAFGNDYPEFWIGLPLSGEASIGGGTHICFRAPDKEAVNQFHAEGLKAGGSNAGEPGLRPEYTNNYYAAFLYDPDGHKIEAVTYLTDAS